MKAIKKVWDVASVKAELPDIKVRVAGRIIKARIGGRLNPFATVTTAGSWGSYEAAWGTIVYCLNNGRPLVVS